MRTWCPVPQAPERSQMRSLDCWNTRLTGLQPQQLWRRYHLCWLHQDCWSPEEWAMQEQGRAEQEKTSSERRGDHVTSLERWEWGGNGWLQWASVTGCMGVHMGVHAGEGGIEWACKQGLHAELPIDQCVDEEVAWDQCTTPWTNTTPQSILNLLVNLVAQNDCFPYIE